MTASRSKVSTGNRVSSWLFSVIGWAGTVEDVHASFIGDPCGVRKVGGRQGAVASVRAERTGMCGCLGIVATTSSLLTKVAFSQLTLERGDS
jgi:hypothetical protein